MTRRALIWIRVAWVAATCVLAAAWRAEALALLVPLAFLGPLVRETVPPADEDERQRLEDYRASHIALMTVFALLFVLIAKSLVVDGAGIPSDLLLLFAVPLVVRAGLSIGRGLGARRAGLAIGFTVGAVWLAFTLLSHGISVDTLVESAIGGGIVAATAAALRWPRAGGALLVALGVAFLVLVVWSQIGRGAWGFAFAMTSVLAAPPIVAGLLLYSSAPRRQAAGADEFGDLRMPKP